MKLYPDRLHTALDQGLAPLYLVGGDEPLLVTESADAIRAAAKAAGYTDRRVLHVEAGFDWSSLRAAGQAMSLFSDKTLIEVHMPTGTPGRDGGAAIRAACESPPKDTVILIITGALDARSRKGGWYAQIEKVGATVYCWPLKGDALRSWLNARLTRAGLSAEPDAVQLLAERVEGNLLAAAQDIDKMALLFGDGARITVEQMADAVADNARFAVFDLIDKALAGPPDVALRSLDRLREEGVDAVPIIAVLSGQLRTLARVAGARDPERVCQSERVFAKRIPMMVAAARRHSPASVAWLIALASRADRAAKGVDTAEPWDDLITLVWVLAAGRQARDWMAVSAARLRSVWA